MKIVIRILLCFALAGFSIARAVSPGKDLAKTAKTMQKAPSGKKANAKTLLTDSKKALALMVKAARADKGLDPKTPKNKPFWKSTQAVAKSLKKAEKGLAAKSDDFQKGVAEARRGEEQLKVDWQLTDSKNKEVIDNSKKLGHAVALLRTQYSKEAARQKKGGDLTKEEKANFAKVKEQQKELLAKVKKLEAQAKKDKALEKGLGKMQAQANHILKEPITLAAYLATLYLLDEQYGLIRGYEYYVDKPWRADYLLIVGLVPTYDVIYTWEAPVVYDWALVDVPVDIYVGEDVDVSEPVSDADVDSEADFAADQPVDMPEAEQDQVADNEDTDADVDADNTPDDDSMDDPSDDEGGDMSDDGGDGGGDEASDDGGGDDSGDDGGGDDGGE